MIQYTTEYISDKILSQREDFLARGFRPTHVLISFISAKSLSIPTASIDIHGNKLTKWYGLNLVFDDSYMEPLVLGTPNRRGGSDRRTQC